MNPQIQDMAVAQAQSSWVPNVSSSLTNNSTNSPSTSVFSGGQDQDHRRELRAELGVTQMLPTGASYSVAWGSSRATSTNIFNTFDPLLRSNVTFSVSSRSCGTSRSTRSSAARDEQEGSRGVRRAASGDDRPDDPKRQECVLGSGHPIANLRAQHESLDLARRLLADNEKRVQIGTMAPIDIVEAQAEVASNEEAVIVAEADIKRAEDNLRALIFDPSTPDFWTITIEPTDPRRSAIKRSTWTAPFAARSRSASTCRSRETASRGRHRHPVPPEPDAPRRERPCDLQHRAAGGRELTPLTSLRLGQWRARSSRSAASGRCWATCSRSIPDLDGRRHGVVSDRHQQRRGEPGPVAAAAFAGADPAEELELQIATQVRDLARQVQTNQKRIESARAARELAERRLEAEEKKFAAGIQTSFFVFQAQRDLAQARTNESARWPTTPSRSSTSRRPRRPRCSRCRHGRTGVRR